MSFAFSLPSEVCLLDWAVQKRAGLKKRETAALKKG
jgi:hypothetical protein